MTLSPTLSVERALARQHLVQHGAEREEVRASDRLPFLRAARGPCDCTVPIISALGPSVGSFACAVSEIVSSRRFATPKSENLRSRLRQRDVAWLQVAMDDPRLCAAASASAICAATLSASSSFSGPRVETRCDASRLRAAPSRGSRPSPRGRRRTACRCADGSANEIARASRSNRSRDSGLRQVRGEDLDRDVATEPRVLRAVDLAHATGAERAEDFIGAETRPGRSDGMAGGYASERGVSPVSDEPLSRRRRWCRRPSRSRISSSGIVRMSRVRTITSASFPTASEPLMFSSKAA